MKTTVCSLCLVLATLACGGEAPGQGEGEEPDGRYAKPAKGLPGLKLEILAPKTSYELGEPIEVTLRYTYTGDLKLAIEHVTYDRCGRIQSFGFRAVDEKGRAVRDPIADHLGGMGGGLRGFGPLGRDRPYEQKAVVNEWLCFDEPGRYTLTCESGIVSLDPHGTGQPYHGRPVAVTSEPLKLELIPPVDAHRLARIAKAGATLDAKDREAWGKAVDDLRFMVDERAIPLLVWALTCGNGNARIDARFGLVSFRDMRPVTHEILKAVQGKAVLDRDDVQSYASVLTTAHLRARGLKDGWVGSSYGKVYARWQAVLEAKRQQGAKQLTGPEAERAKLDELLEKEARTLDDWKALLEKVPAMTTEQQQRASYQIERGCRRKELLPLLRTLAADERLNWTDLRPGVLKALDAMGDDFCREVLFKDITSPKSRLYNARGLLGDYRAKEVAERLLKLLEQPGEDHGQAARLLAENEFAVAAASVQALRDAYLRAERYFDRDYLLSALARRSPEDAFELVRDIVNGVRPGSQLHGHGVELLAGMDFPAAQPLLFQALHSEDAEQRERLVRSLPPCYFREAFLLFRGDLSGKVRVAAKSHLAELSGIGETAIGPRDSVLYAAGKEEDALAQRWEAWWAENAARFGRWGNVLEGVALKCSTDKGVYEAGEPIWLTIRLRRETGELPLAAEVRVVGERRKPGPDGERPERFDYRGVPFTLSPGEGRAVLADEPRSEAAYRINLHSKLEFREAGTYSFQVRTVVPGRDRDMARWPQSPPLTIQVRPGPSDLTWGEPCDGLAVSVAVPKRKVARRDGLPIEVRLRNVREAEPLTLPAIVSEPCWLPKSKRYDDDRDPELRFLQFALSDEKGTPLDLGPEPEQRRERWEPHGRRPVVAKKVEPAPVELRPGETLLLRATPAWRGRKLRRLLEIDEPSAPPAIAKGGKFALSVAIEVPRDAKLPANVWRGKATARPAEFEVEPFKKTEWELRAERREEEPDDKALGLDQIRLPGSPPPPAEKNPLPKQ